MHYVLDRPSTSIKPKDRNFWSTAYTLRTAPGLYALPLSIHLMIDWLIGGWCVICDANFLAELSTDHELLLPGKALALLRIRSLHAPAQCLASRPNRRHRHHRNKYIRFSQKKKSGEQDITGANKRAEGTRTSGLVCDSGIHTLEQRKQAVL
jgi:hypothetical protein